MKGDIPLEDLGPYKPHDISTAAASNPETALLAKEDAEFKEKMMAIFDSLIPKNQVMLRLKFGIVTPTKYKPEELAEILFGPYPPNEQRRKELIEMCNDPSNEALYALVHGTAKTALPEMSFAEVGKMLDISPQNATAAYSALKTRFFRSQGRSPKDSARPQADSAN